VKTRMQQARAAILLATSKDQTVLTEAINTIAARGDRDALQTLNGAVGKIEGEAATLLTNSINGINNRLQIWNAGQNIWYGISLGSVLLLAAIGLAITFGVMGVINMAHGEMVMLGAYTTFVVQEVIRQRAGAVRLVAGHCPAAGLSRGGGRGIDHRAVGIIRLLYGRPLETLLATWGLSLILQQAIRTIFGATNREVSNPQWMSDGFQIGRLRSPGTASGS
jgi:urea transport system permease protein